MRIKFPNLQMILQLMGNHISCVHIHPKRELQSVKLIKWDGMVKIYYQPIPVSQVLVDYPKHLVCRSDSFYIGQKIPPLSHHDLLQLGHNYFLLPNHYFHTVLTFVSVASFLKTYNNQSTNSRLAISQVFDIQKSPSGCLRIRVSDEFISQLMHQTQTKDVNSDHNKLCTTPQLVKDYRLLVASPHWKPKLETIREKEKKKLSSFGMKRRKKSHSKTNHLPPTISSKSSSKANHLPPTISSKSSSKAKIKIKIKLRKSKQQ